MATLITPLSRGAWALSLPQTMASGYMTLDKPLTLLLHILCGLLGPPRLQQPLLQPGSVLKTPQLISFLGRKRGQDWAAIRGDREDRQGSRLCLAGGMWVGMSRIGAKALSTWEYSQRGAVTMTRGEGVWQIAVVSKRR